MNVYTSDEYVPLALFWVTRRDFEMLPRTGKPPPERKSAVDGMKGVKVGDLFGLKGMFLDDSKGEPLLSELPTAGKAVSDADVIVDVLSAARAN